jgi:hypothetical protein
MQAVPKSNENQSILRIIGVTDEKGCEGSEGQDKYDCANICFELSYFITYILIIKRFLLHFITRSLC